MLSTHKKNCPKCNGEQIYKNRKQLLKAVSNDTQCEKCQADSFRIAIPSRNCPECNGIIRYKRMEHYRRAVKNNATCKGCSSFYNHIPFSKKACGYIDTINEQMGLQIQHALNGGEQRCGRFSLDGYDKSRNIVFEYDESAHRTRKVYNNDFERQQYIEERFNPILFMRYDELNNRLYDSLTNQTIQ